MGLFLRCQGTEAVRVYHDMFWVATSIMTSGIELVTEMVGTNLVCQEATYHACNVLLASIWCQVPISI